jgi:hypothetical protein
VSFIPIILVLGTVGDMWLKSGLLEVKPSGTAGSWCRIGVTGASLAVLLAIYPSEGVSEEIDRGDFISALLSFARPSAYTRGVTPMILLKTRWKWLFVNPASSAKFARDGIAPFSICVFSMVCRALATTVA